MDAAAIENITPGEALEKLLMAIESGDARGGGGDRHRGGAGPIGNRGYPNR